MPRQQQQQQQLRPNLSCRSIETILRWRAQSRGSAGEDGAAQHARPHAHRPVQTLLYCSEACRKKDLEWAWPVPMPSAREILERDSSADRLKATDSAHLATKTKSHGKEKRVSLGAHPAQLNPAHASPPPPSPVLPPVPPNSWRAPNLRDLRALDLGATTLHLARSEFLHELERDRAVRRLIGFVHGPRSPAAPSAAPSAAFASALCIRACVVTPTSDTSADKRPLFEGGILMAAKRLQAISRSGAADGEQAKEEMKLLEEHVKEEEEERRRAWDLTGEAEREAHANRRAGKVEAKLEEVETIDPARWSDLVYNYGGNSNPSAPAGIISTHRRPSTGAASDPQANADNAATVRAPGALTRTQSALELYAKCPFFVRAPSSSSTSPAPRAKSNANLATSYAPAFGSVTSTSTSKFASTKSATTSVSDDAYSGVSALTLSGVDPALYAGKRRVAHRRPHADNGAPQPTPSALPPCHCVALSDADIARLLAQLAAAHRLAPPTAGWLAIWELLFACDMPARPAMRRAMHMQLAHLCETVRGPSAAHLRSCCSSFGCKHVERAKEGEDVPAVWELTVHKIMVAMMLVSGYCGCDGELDAPAKLANTSPVSPAISAKKRLQGVRQFTVPAQPLAHPLRSAHPSSCTFDILWSYPAHRRVSLRSTIIWTTAGELSTRHTQPTSGSPTPASICYYRMAINLSRAARQLSVSAARWGGTRRGEYVGSGMPPPLPPDIERLEWHGFFLIEDGQTIFLRVVRDAVPQFVMDVFGLPLYDQLRGDKVKRHFIFQYASS
ncbi:hypothetical protein DFH11DRAFT_1760892 [Phellopilus nigrolimitatus]|nr:hypothetical protein DFH11DRAFT_1760892 [Phellopilus nigrolimitatus]